MNLPSREECEGWNQAQVAFFLSKNKMQECVATVYKLNINGQRLLSLSDSDISKFTLIHQPQLQKIVQDIKKNDNSLLNKLRRLKNKPLPKVPARDYRDNDPQSESDYDNDMYEDPHEEWDDSYEPPPTQRLFTSTPSASFSREDYLDNCHNPQRRPPKKPLRPRGKASKQLPPEPASVENYIDLESSGDDDNYVEPAESSPNNHMMHGGSRARADLPLLPKPLPKCPPSPDFYEVPETEKKSFSLPANRLCTVPTTQSHSLPPTPSPRLNLRTSPTPEVQEPTAEDEYEVCDPEDSISVTPGQGHPVLPPNPSPRQGSPKPPLKPRPNLQLRELESQTLPAVTQTEPKLTPKSFTLDLNRPQIPPRLFTSCSDRSVSSDWSTDPDKVSDLHNKPWYAGACDRKTADDTLIRSNKDGAFMVRNSSGHDAQQPFTLVVFYNSRVYNIPVRYISTAQQYALGREKKGEEHFNSVSHIIEIHQRNPLVLIDSQSNTKDTTKLTYPTKPYPH